MGVEIAKSVRSVRTPYGTNKKSRRQCQKIITTIVDNPEVFPKHSQIAINIKGG